MSTFTEQKVKLSIHLHPSRLNNVQQGVEEQLNQYLMNYVEDLGGVVLSYSEVTLQEQAGAIFYERPFIHFHVICKMVIFGVKVGSQLIGTVNKIGSDHIGLLVYGGFNASISSRSIGKHYSYDSTRDVWFDTRIPSAASAASTTELNNIVNADEDPEEAEALAAQAANKPLTKKQKKKLERKALRAEKQALYSATDSLFHLQTGVLSIGTQVRFEVTHLHNTDRYFSIHGSLLSSSTGIVEGLGYLPPSYVEALKESHLETLKWKQAADGLNEQPIKTESDSTEDEMHDINDLTHSNASSVPADSASEPKVTKAQLKKQAKADLKKAKLEERLAKKKSEGTFVDQNGGENEKKKRKGDEESTSSKSAKKQKVAS